MAKIYATLFSEFDVFERKKKSKSLPKLYFSCRAFASLYENVEKYRGTSMMHMNAYETSAELVDILVSYATTG